MCDFKNLTDEEKLYFHELLKPHTPVVQSPLLSFLIIIEIADLDNPR